MRIGSNDVGALIAYKSAGVPTFSAAHTLIVNQRAREAELDQSALLLLRLGNGSRPGWNLFQPLTSGTV